MPKPNKVKIQALVFFFSFFRFEGITYLQRVEMTPTPANRRKWAHRWLWGLSHWTTRSHCRSVWAAGEERETMWIWRQAEWNQFLGCLVVHDNQRMCPSPENLPQQQEGHTSNTAKSAQKVRGAAVSTADDGLQQQACPGSHGLSCQSLLSLSLAL